MHYLHEPADANRKQTLLWATPGGLRCVMIPYDERRFQLRLLRPQGTIRTDLFAGRAAAMNAAGDWLERVVSPNRVE
jgi:hypothetical protein